MLNRLVEREGVCILYTHLGKSKCCDGPFGPPTRDALRSLAEYYRDGRILITTTRRLLGFCRALREVSITAVTEAGGLRIELTTAPSSPGGYGELAVSDLDGLTFYVPHADATRVLLNGREVRDLCRNGADHSGRCSVSLAWRSLEFPCL